MGIKAIVYRNKDNNVDKEIYFDILSHISEVHVGVTVIP